MEFGLDDGSRRSFLNRRVSRSAFLQMGLLFAAACTPAAPSPTAAPAKPTEAPKPVASPSPGASPAAAAPAPAPAAAAPAPAGAPIPIRFTLDFVVGGQHAPWFVALDKGYYRDEGLDVSITPGQASSAVMQRLAGGDVQFAFADFNGIVLSRTQGTVARAVMCCYAKAPYVIFSLASSNITKPKDLEGKRLITNPGSPVPQVFRIIAQRDGLDESKIVWNTVDGAAKAQLIVSGQADATDYFIVQKPLIERAAAGRPLNMMTLTDYGIVSYSNSVAVLEEYLTRNADVVRRFVAASAKGWDDTFARPDEAVSILVKHNPTIDGEVARAVIDVTRDIAFLPETRDRGIGYMDPGKVKETVDNITKAFDVKDPPAPDQTFTNDFLPRR